MPNDQVYHKDLGRDVIQKSINKPTKQTTKIRFLNFHRLEGLKKRARIKIILISESQSTEDTAIIQWLRTESLNISIVRDWKL